MKAPKGANQLRYKALGGMIFVKILTLAYSMPHIYVFWCYYFQYILCICDLQCIWLRGQNVGIEATTLGILVMWVWEVRRVS